MDTNKPVWPTSYVPPPELPQWFEEELTTFGGKNDFGEPNYRVVWGMDARTFMNDNPRAVKYGNPNDMNLGWACWILERWAAPGFYNKQEWKDLRYGKDEAGTGKIIDYLGPYPWRGSYIAVDYLTDDDLEMIPLSRRLLEELQRKLDQGSQGSAILGRLEANRLHRQAKNAELLDKEIKARREYYETHGAEINAVHSRNYSGLLKTIDPSAIARTATLIPHASK